MTSLPMSPIDIMLGEFPRWYFVGDQVISAETYDKQAFGAISGVPLQQDKSISQEDVLKYKMFVKNRSEINGVPCEIVEKTPHTEETLNAYIDKLKHTLCADLLQNGIPVKHIDTTIRYSFQKKEYEFDVDVLAALDLFRFPASISTSIRDGSTHALNMAAHALRIPCKHNGRFHLFTAQHKSATDLLQKYFTYHTSTYVEELNALTAFISEYVFDETHTIGVLWETLYGTENYYGQIERVKLVR